LCIKNKNDGTTRTKDSLGVDALFKKIDLSRKVPDLELDEAVVGDLGFDKLRGALQKKCVVWRHLVKDHFLNA